MIPLLAMSSNNPIDLLSDTSNGDDFVICFVFKQFTNTFSLGTIGTGSYINLLSVVFLSVDCVGILSLVYIFTSDVVLMVEEVGIHHQFELL